MLRLLLAFPRKIKFMIDFASSQFTLFLAAALILAFSPGPGIAYVVARTAAGGKRSGVASSIGTGLGGLVHVAAAAFGLSALIAKSAFLFSFIKYAGACYLIYLGVKVLLSRESFETPIKLQLSNNLKAFRDGFIVEAFNVKTALFFLAFIPQFINPGDSITFLFVFYGIICVFLNTTADLIAVAGTGYLLTKLKSGRPINIISGSTLIGLGIFVAVNDAKR